MKKIIFTAIVLSLVCLCAASCAKDDAVKNDDSEPDTETVADTTEKETEPEKESYDFASCSVSGKVLLESDEEVTLEGYNRFILQKNGIADVSDDGIVRAVSDGVTLLACIDDENDMEKVYVVCVLPEGVRPDPSAPSPELHQMGTSFPASFGTRNAVFRSSNEEVVTVNDEGNVCFLAPGYAVITVEGVSVPTFYSYIVYEK